MNATSSAVLEPLLDLVLRLYGDTAGFLNTPGDQQLWYDRGYANGMIQALGELGYGGQVARRLRPDPPDIVGGQEFLPWGKAYRHGVEVGMRETHEIMEAV